MRSPYFFAGREQELRAVIRRPDRTPPDHDLRSAGCRGTDVEAFFPEAGPPDDLVLARCTGCPVRLACLALALRGEEQGQRWGWYGGLGPEERDGIAAALGLEVLEPPTPDRAARAARLRAAGLTVDAIAAEFGCSRRTAQRYLRRAG